MNANERTMILEALRAGAAEVGTRLFDLQEDAEFQPNLLIESAETALEKILATIELLEK